VPVERHSERERITHEIIGNYHADCFWVVRNRAVPEYRWAPLASAALRRCAAKRGLEPGSEIRLQTASRYRCVRELTEWWGNQI